MATDVLKQPQSKTLSNLSEEVTAFSNFMACKMMQYPENTRKLVEYDIIDILKKADLGYYNKPHSLQSANSYNIHTFTPLPQSSSSSHSSSTQFYPNTYSGQETHSGQLASSEPPTKNYITLMPLAIPSTSQQNADQQEQANNWNLSNTQKNPGVTSPHHSIYSPSSNYSEDINEFV